MINYCFRPWTVNLSFGQITEWLLSRRTVNLTQWQGTTHRREAQDQSLIGSYNLADFQL